jgi:hypothetical protein
MKPVACRPFLKRQLFSHVKYQLQNTVCVKQNIANKRASVPRMEFILTTDCTDPAAAGRIHDYTWLHRYIVTSLHRYIVTSLHRYIVTSLQQYSHLCNPCNFCNFCNHLPILA